MASSLNGTGVTFNDSTQQGSAWVGLRGVLYTSNSTFTVPAGVTSLNVMCIGGGGGGSYTTYAAAGFPGGKGGFAGGYVTVTPGSTYTVTVGAGGAGVWATANGNFPGNSGGTSSFGSLISATGGGGSGIITSGGYATQGANGSGTNGTYITGWLSNNSSLFTIPPFVGLTYRGTGPTNTQVAAITWTVSGGFMPGAGGNGSPCTGPYACGGVSGIVLLEY